MGAVSTIETERLMQNIGGICMPIKIEIDEGELLADQWE